MQVIEIFLPLRRKDGSLQPSTLFRDARTTLVQKFGGLTAYTRAPAEGYWEHDHGAVEKDAVIIFEVVAEKADRTSWSRFREELEQRFEQEAILIRAFAAERL